MTKGSFSLEFGFALHCDGCFVVVMGGVFFLKASPGSLLHIEVSNMKEPSCILSRPKRSRVRVPCCLMLIVTITAKQFLVSLLLDDWEAAVGRVCGDSAVNLQRFCSCSRLGRKVWVQGAVSRTSAAEILASLPAVF